MWVGEAETCAGWGATEWHLQRLSLYSGGCTEQQLLLRARTAQRAQSRVSPMRQQQGDGTFWQTAPS